MCVCVCVCLSMMLCVHAIRHTEHLREAKHFDFTIFISLVIVCERGMNNFD